MTCIKECATCHNNFSMRYSENSSYYNKIKYCSKKCFINKPKKINNIECIVCGKIKKVKSKFELKNKYCSHKCYWQNMKGKIREDIKGYWKNKKKPETCNKKMSDLFRGKLRTNKPTTYRQLNKLGLSHRAIWSAHNTGVYIPKGWCVHHITGDRLDNRIQNLQLMPRDYHQSLHMAIRNSKGKLKLPMVP